MTDRAARAIATRVAQSGVCAWSTCGQSKRGLGGEHAPGLALQRTRSRVSALAHGRACSLGPGRRRRGTRQHPPPSVRWQSTHRKALPWRPRRGRSPGRSRTRRLGGKTTRGNIARVRPSPVMFCARDAPRRRQGAAARGCALAVRLSATQEPSCHRHRARVVRMHLMGARGVSGPRGCGTPTQAMSPGQQAQQAQQAQRAQQARRARRHAPAAILDARAHGVGVCGAQTGKRARAQRRLSERPARHGTRHSTKHGQSALGESGTQGLKPTLNQMQASPVPGAVFLAYLVRST